VTATEWIESLTPWPAEFGLERMQALVRELGEPQRRFPSIHVVGSVGKGTAVRTIEELLGSEGFDVGSYLSPHVSGWAERIRVHGEEADFETAVARVRPAAERLGATQFEALTAAALVAFADAAVDVAVLEAGLGGRLDATNVIAAPVVLLTKVVREHTQVLGETPEQIAHEKLAVAHAARVVVVPDNTFAHLVQRQARIVLGGAREAAEAFAGRPIAHDVTVSLPGRLERRGDDVWDGAHTPDAVEWLLERIGDGPYVLCVSVLRDKDVDGILERLAAAGDILVATRSSNPRALAPEELARHARPYFGYVETIAEPGPALARARSFGAPVLVTGSLYLLADLHGVRTHAVP
jgi:dihydrofolate synthase/folylpolyglutamate synthase